MIPFNNCHALSLLSASHAVAVKSSDEIMVYNIDVCQAVVESTPAPKATVNMRKRKLAYKKLHHCFGMGWGTLACMADPFIGCLVMMLVIILTWSNQQKWSKLCHPLTCQHISYSVSAYQEVTGKMSKKRKFQFERKLILLYCLVYEKVDETWISHKTTVFEQVECCNDRARNVFMYLQTAVSIYLHWPVLQVLAVLITMSLILSGDVELNPGPLTSDDLKKILNSLWDARTKWYNMGIQLEMKVPVLETIKQNHPNEVDLCFTMMLTEWLKQTDPPPTWEALVDALKSSSVGYGELGRTIQKSYCSKSEITTSAIDDSTHTPFALKQSDVQTHEKGM